MRLQLYGLKNCDTCKKAVKWLEAEDIPFEFVDIRDNTPEVATITGWLVDVGPDALINRRSTTWRNLDETTREQLNGTQAAETLGANPTLIKRPVLVGAGPTLSGFDQKAWASVLI